MISRQQRALECFSNAATFQQVARLQLTYALRPLHDGQLVELSQRAAIPLADLKGIWSNAQRYYINAGIIRRLEGHLAGICFSKLLGDMIVSDHDRTFFTQQMKEEGYDNLMAYLELLAADAINAMATETGNDLKVLDCTFNL